MNETKAMKIDHPHVSVESPKPVGKDAERASAQTVRTGAEDVVRLSGDLQLAERAVRAASDNGRPDVVARFRRLDEQGILAVDVERLADRMIDALIHSHDPNA